MVKRIAYTPGEPAGIGPDLIILLQQLPPDVELVILADPRTLYARAEQLQRPLSLHPLTAQPRPSRPGCFSHLPLYPRSEVVPGRLDKNNADYVLATLRRAVVGCLNGEFAALVTGPIHKGVINDAGYRFSGHTEFLAEESRSDKEPVMMLATAGLRVALATTHLPLREVAASITRERLEPLLRTLHHDLRQRFAIPRPRILVAGLNPHAGEGGHLGREEVEIIDPLLQQLRGEGMDVVGSLPADTLFTPKYLEHADAVLAMYHDQGLPVLKHKGFGRAVNITLGLPLIRTSVDHGTALELAGSGQATTGSLELAIATALEMVGEGEK